MTSSTLPYRLALMSLSVLLALLTQAPCPASADDGGLVLNIRNGRLERRASDAWEVLAVGDPVAFRQRLKTDPTALAVLELPQVGRYVLGPDSDVELGRSVPDATNNLKKGSVWIEAKLAPGNSLTVQTALASSGVRGTKFTVIADKRDMDLCTCKGAVDVTLKDGSTVRVGSGEACNLDAQGKATGQVSKGQMILAKYSAKSKRFGICYECHTKTGLKKGWTESVLASEPKGAGLAVPR